MPSTAILLGTWARAGAGQDERILGDVDNIATRNTRNGVKAYGGPLDGLGAVIARGILYVNSGYCFVGSALGNVLLAFSVGGK
jgi:polyvinyl alcohol dehydrogenase (cytochrome)